jgi:hypothetical protein
VIEPLPDREGVAVVRKNSIRRRPHLGCRLANHSSVFLAFELLIRMRAAPGLDVLVRVLDHYDRGIYHRANRNRDAAERWSAA